MNQAPPLLHHGFEADRRALPIFLIFHPLAARLITLRDSRNRKQEATVLQPEPKPAPPPTPTPTLEECQTVLLALAKLDGLQGGRLLSGSNQVLHGILCRVGR